jgi:hypothetical protein
LLLCALVSCVSSLPNAEPFTRASAQLRAAGAESGRSSGSAQHEQLTQKISDVLAQLQQLRADVEQLA